MNDALLYIPKRHKIPFTDFYINCSHLVERPRTQSQQLNPYHLQETAKNTSLPSLFDPRTLALSILILFRSSFYLKKHKHLTLYQLHIYSLTASFSCKTNTKFNVSISVHTSFLKKKKASSVYCVRLTRTCNSTCMLLLFCWFWLLL